jgi:hypothetical protein
LGHARPSSTGSWNYCTKLILAYFSWKQHCIGMGSSISVDVFVKPM